jgi:hypothetical protein
MWFGYGANSLLTLQELQQTDFGARRRTRILESVCLMSSRDWTREQRVNGFHWT